MSLTLWDPERSYECVALRDVVLDLRIGAFPAEELAPQPVRVDVELYRRRPGQRRERLEDCVNYDRVYGYLTGEWPGRPHTSLLEQLAEDLVAFCLADVRVEAVRVIIRKLAIYEGRAVPEIQLYRRRDC